MGSTSITVIAPSNQPGRTMVPFVPPVLAGSVRVPPKGSPRNSTIKSHVPRRSMAPGTNGASPGSRKRVFGGTELDAGMLRAGVDGAAIESAAELVFDGGVEAEDTPESSTTASTPSEGAERAAPHATGPTHTIPKMRNALMILVMAGIRCWERSAGSSTHPARNPVPTKRWPFDRRATNWDEILDTTLVAERSDHRRLSSRFRAEYAASASPKHCRSDSRSSQKESSVHREKNVGPSQTLTSQS